MRSDPTDWAGTTHRSLTIDLDHHGVAGCTVWTRPPGGRLTCSPNYTIGTTSDSMDVILGRAARIAARIWWGNTLVSSPIGTPATAGGLTGSDLDGRQMPLPWDD